MRSCPPQNTPHILRSYLISWIQPDDGQLVAETCSWYLMYHLLLIQLCFDYMSNYVLYDFMIIIHVYEFVKVDIFITLSDVSDAYTVPVQDKPICNLGQASISFKVQLLFLCTAANKLPTIRSILPLPSHL